MVSFARRSSSVTFSSTPSFHASATLSLKRCGHAVLVGMAMVGLLFGADGIASAQALPSTTTTVMIATVAAPTAAITTVAGGTPIALTATITLASGGLLSGPGLVNFCDASALRCTDIHLLGTASVIAGVATLRFIPAPGAHSYKAVFLSGALTALASSTSTAMPLAVTAGLTTQTILTSTGSAGTYTLSATVPGSILTHPAGTVSFVDQSAAAPGVLSNVPLVRGSGPVSFVASTASAAGAKAPLGALIADFNGDGINDAVITSLGSITLLLGNGDGTFRPNPVTQNISAFKTMIATDLNGDGLLDLVIEGNGVTAYLNNGTGGFSRLPSIPFTFGNTDNLGSALGAGDFNGDGIVDLLFALEVSGSVEVVFGKGDGTFSAPVLVATVGRNADGLVVGDFNNDGNADFAVTSYGSDNIYLGTGMGTFTLSSHTSGAGTPGRAITADFNGDGNADVAVVSTSGSGLLVSLGNGAGGLSAGAGIDINTSNPPALTVGDFNDDGIPDLATVSNTTATILLGTGTIVPNGINLTKGAFLLSNLTLPTGAVTRAIAAGDLDGDGIPDVLVTDDVITTAPVAIPYLATGTSISTATATGITLYGDGMHMLVAQFPGDPAYGASTSTSISLVGISAPTTLTLAAAPTSSTYGAQVSMTITIAPYSEPSGVGTVVTTDGDPVSLYNGTTLIGTGLLSTGQATIFVTTLPTGTLSLHAEYAGHTGSTGQTFAPSTSNTLSFTVTSAFALLPAVLPAPVFGIPYSQTITASGPTAPYAFTTASTLPTGLTLTAGGLLSGTPTQAGTFSITVVATDSSTPNVTQPITYSIVIAPPTIAILPAYLSYPYVGIAYSQRLTASGGAAPYTFTSGTLPAGLTLSPAGLLSGTATQSGSFTLTMAATDSSTGSGPYTRTVLDSFLVGSPSLNVSVPGSVTPVIGVAYYQPVSAIGGTAPYTYVASGFPAGLFLLNGFVQGTPTQTGAFRLSVRTTDSSTGGGPFSQQSSWQQNIVNPGLTILPSTLPSPQAGFPYSQTITTTAGTAPYAYTSTTLPAGLVLSAGGLLTGTPTQTGTFSVVVTTTDSTTGTGSHSQTLTYSLVVVPSITILPASIASPQIGVPYSQTITASGATAPYTFMASGLPVGLFLSPSGVLSGMPTQVGAFSIVVTATDSASHTQAITYPIVIAAPSIAVLPASIASPQIGVPFSQVITASGGTASYRFTATALPAGLAFSTSGVLSGVATEAGAFTVSITASDSSTGTGAPFQQTRVYTSTVTPPSLVLPAGVIDATFGAVYTQNVGMAGGTAPYSEVISGGNLPAGITLRANGVLTGTLVTGGGPYTFTVSAVDSSTGIGAPFVLTQVYTMSVTPFPIVVASPSSANFATIPANTTGNAWTITLNNTSATPALITGFVLSDAVNFAQTNTCGTILTGYSNCNILVTFVPKAAGTFNGTLTINDSAQSNPQTVTMTGTSTSDAPTVVVSPTNLSFADVMVGSTGNTQTVTISNTGATPLVISNIASSDQADFSIASSCSGTLAPYSTCNLLVALRPQAAGPVTGTLTVADNASPSTQSVSLSGNGLSNTPTVLVSPTNLSFADAAVGSTGNAQTVTINNTGSTALLIAGIVSSDQVDFVVASSCSGMLAAHSTCNLLVSLKPQATGSIRGTLAINDNASPGTQVITLSGNGLSNTPTVVVSPTNLSFADVLVGSTGNAQMVTIHNTGSTPLIFTGIVSSDQADFVVTSACAGTLAAHSTCNLAVALKPQAAGPIAGTITISDNASPATQVIALSGNGLSNIPTVLVSPSNFTFANVTVGGTGNSQTATINNIGSTPLLVSSIVLSDPADFVLAGSCIGTIAPHTTCNLTVALKPQAAGSIAGTLTVTDNANPAAQVIALSGTGDAAPVPSLSIAVNPSALSLQVGSTGHAAFSMTPTNGYRGSVALSCGGLPSGVTCQFAPATLTSDGSNTVQTSQLTVNTSGLLVGANRSSASRTSLAAVFSLSGLWMGLLMLRRRRSPLVRALRLMVPMLLLTALAALTGCGTGAAGSYLAVGNHAVTVTATGDASASAGAIVQTANFTLIITQ